MNCEKLQAPSVQAFRQDKLQLFPPDCVAMLIYIIGRSALLHVTSLKGKIDRLTCPLSLSELSS